MTREEEYTFLANFSGAMRHAESVRGLDALWRDYESQIAQCSPEGQKELHGLRARRSGELMGA